GGDRDRECAAVRERGSAHAGTGCLTRTIALDPGPPGADPEACFTGQLTAGIAHEIKNPLNFVNNFSAVSAELIDEIGETLEGAKFDGKTGDQLAKLMEM